MRTIVRAAELLEEEADTLLHSYTVVDDDHRSNGGCTWDDTDEQTREAHCRYDELLTVASDLRRIEAINDD